MTYRSTLRLAMAASFAIAFGVLAALPLHAAVTYSGRAFAAFVNTPVTGPIYISDTGNLPAQGGQLHAGLLDVSVPGILSADVASASTSGASGNADSRASLADVVLTAPGAPPITASFLQARTHASCDGVTASSEIVDLTVGGQQITVSGQANQTISLPLGVTLIINEQKDTSSGNLHEITGSALHLIVPGVAEVILSGVHSDVKCALPITEGPCHDFITGGGWITTPSGAKGNFGAHAGSKTDMLPPFTGHLNYIDHGTGMKVHGLGVTSYSASGTCRTFSGPCEVNGASGFTYTVTMCDNGEPGTADVFSISLSNGYSAGGTLQGGNIQLHHPCKK